MLLPTHNPFFFKIIIKADSKFDKRFYILIGKNLLAQQNQLAVSLLP